VDCAIVKKRKTIELLNPAPLSSVLDFNRMEAMSIAQIMPPYKWWLNQLLKFLAPIAETLENTSHQPPPLTIITRTNSRTIILDSTTTPLVAQDHIQPTL